MPAPTPLHRLHRLEEQWGCPKIYIKRDDMTGIGPGGNKIRSLEYILGEAVKEGSKVILAAGPAQSNLCTLTAAACAKVGLDCELVHNGTEPEKKQGNLLLNQILGVKSHFLGDVDSDARNAFVEELFEKYRREGRNPYVVRNGATTGRGALGYTAAVPELMKQCPAHRWRSNLLCALFNNNCHRSRVRSVFRRIGALHGCQTCLIGSYSADTIAMLQHIHSFS